jgi:hypothetical protein
MLMLGAEHRHFPGVKALTVHQPWAWSLIYGGKDIENRRWKTSYRGALLIHAGIHTDPDGVGELLRTMADPGSFGQPRSSWEARGAIIGLVFLADVLTDSPSRWALPHRYHWALEFPSPIEPAVTCRGHQGLWTPPAELIGRLADML